MSGTVDLKALVLLKGEHKYYFVYVPGQEESLVDELLDIALDPSLNLGWSEVIYLLREHGLAPAASDAPQPGES